VLFNVYPVLPGRERVPVRVALPVFPIVKVFCDVVPTITIPNARTVGIDITGTGVTVPVPDNATVDVFPEALCVNIKIELYD
jgi:hypothetical protein